MIISRWVSALMIIILLVSGFCAANKAHPVAQAAETARFGALFASEDVKVCYVEADARYPQGLLELD